MSFPEKKEQAGEFEGEWRQPPVAARPAYEDRFLATFSRIKRYLRRVFPFQRAPRRAAEGRALGRARISQSCTWARPPENAHPWRSLFVLSRVRLYSASRLQTCRACTSLASVLAVSAVGSVLLPVLPRMG